MSLILNIDTATDIAHISISKSGVILDSVTNKEQKDHGSFLQPAIQQLLKNNFISIQELDAIAISAGPGSYTGLRVGMASAKGLCFALQKPLITIDAFIISANDALKQINTGDAIICPMIDARRMEVFTIMYNLKLQEINAPSAMVLNNDSFNNVIAQKAIYFTGSGARKFQDIFNNNNAHFLAEKDMISSMAELSEIKYIQGVFDDLRNTEPFYLKDFQAFSTSAK